MPTTTTQGGDAVPDTKKTDSTFTLVAIGLVVYFMFIREPANPGPDPSPGPDKPVVVSDLSKEIAAALDGTPDDTARQYAAFYWAASQYLAGPDGPRPLAQRRDVVVQVKNGLDLQSPQAFKDIVARELKPYSKGDVDRDDYAAALLRLSDACYAAGG